MAITVKHTKVSSVPDGADTSLVRPSDWNADHSLAGIGTMAEQDANSVAITGGSINGTSLGATTAASGKFTTVDIASGLTLATNAGTSGQILSSTGAGTVPTWIDNYATQIKMTVKNDQGSTITKGQVVYVSGANGTNVLVKLALADSDITSATTIGFLEQDLVANATGLVVLEGSLTGIDTSSASAGDPIWLSGTTPGGVIYGIANKPQAPTHLVYLGVVVRSNAINGEISVQVNNGWELDELHNVKITSPTTGQTIVYDSATQLWNNSGAVVVSDGSVNNSPIGATTPSTGKFTTLESTGTGSFGTTNAQYIQAIGDATYPGLYAAGSGTNIPLVLQPKGTGALQAQKTDSTATGGNARGANAVDWQTARNAATQVASGYYNIIGGGYANTGTASAAVTTQSATMNGTTAVTLSGSNASIKVGQYITGTSISANTYVAAVSGTSLTLSQNASGSSTSTLTFYTPHGVVVGGGNNQATGSYSFIGGGGDAGTAANRNTASGDWSSVVGGLKNTASGIGSIVAGGGLNASTAAAGNTASGLSSFVGAGNSNTASSNYSSVIAGQSNTANANSAMVSGAYGTARGITGNQVLSACVTPITATVGISQSATLVLARATTDATATVLCSDSSAAGTSNQVILPNNSAYYFTGEIIAGVTGAGNTKGWTIAGVIKRGANAASTVMVGTPTATSSFADAGASTWTVALAADTTNGGLKITVTGQAATTIRWVARVKTVEMTY